MFCMPYPRGHGPIILWVTPVYIKMVDTERTNVFMLTKVSICKVHQAPSYRGSDQDYGELARSSLILRLTAAPHRGHSSRIPLR